MRFSIPGREDVTLQCRNSRIQLGIPKRTVKGVSEVHGWGLYAGEDIAKSEFISEYKGELISIPEGNRRGTVYHNLKLEYLFKLSKDQELDGSRFSNKARFINNSSVAKNINVLSKKLLCNGVIRIMLYAARDITAGEELFYDYGYDKEVRKNFKEKLDPVKRTMRPPTVSATGDFTALSIAPSTAPSVRSEPRVLSAHDELDFDELDDEPIVPTSGPESEFGTTEGVSEDSSEDSDVDSEAEENNDINPRLLERSSRPVRLRRPRSKDGSVKSNPRRNLYQLHDSPNNRPRKQQRVSLSQPKLPRSKPPLLPGSDSYTPLRGRVLSRTKLKDNNSSEEHLKLHPRRVPVEQRRRKIKPGDKRLGGEAQRKAAATRQKRLEAERLAAAKGESVQLAGKKRKRSLASSPPVEESSPSQPLMVKLRKPARSAGASARVSKSRSPEAGLPEDD